MGGVRNWDYRYAWIRDAAFAVFALRRIGFANEADAFLGWVLDAFEQSRWPRIMYTLTEGPVPEEREDTLAGYRNPAPVRWGNGTADQRQHDVFGEVLDCADQWVGGGGQLAPTLWNRLAKLAEAAKRNWRNVRSPSTVPPPLPSGSVCRGRLPMAICGCNQPQRHPRGGVGR